jgi:beta-lactam-binding protein with PASTA domain
MSKTNQKEGVWDYLKSSIFIKQLLFLIGAFLLLIFIILMWLRFYTNHGQQLELPKFIGQNIEDAKAQSEDLSFEIIVNDSIFIVGKEGGIITDQNPKPLSLVKEGRKVYVTITKFGTETVKVADLPTLYGNAFDQKKTELKYRDIECVIKDYMYDPGEPNHILEVWYNNELIISKDGRNNEVEITKGGTLECVVSQRDGGDVTIPDLKCLELDEARFLLESSKLQLGDIIKKVNAEPDAVLYIVSQSPMYDGISNIKMGEKINVTVSASRPVECN